MRCATIPFRMPDCGCRDRIFPAAVILIVLVMVGIGCGKKADPIPPKAVAPKAATELAVQGTGSGISVAWTMPANAVDVTGFRILRGELPAGDAGCPGCPREFGLIADLAPGVRELANEGGRYRYHDGGVKDGRYYTYRVIACYRSGICSAPQESAEIQFHEGTK